MAAILLCVFDVIRPTLFSVKLLARLSFVSDADVLHTRIVPVRNPPVMVLVWPSDEYETYGRLPFTTMPALSAGEIAVITSPVSTEAFDPLRVASIKVIQPCSHPPVVAHVAPSALMQTVTRLPSLVASDRERANEESRSFFADVSRVDAIIPWKLGIATAIKMASIAIVTINSMSVKPFKLKCCRSEWV